VGTIKEITKLSNGKELDIKYPIRLCDKDGNETYYEDSDGYWQKCEYDDGKEVYFENSDGYWWNREYKDGKVVYHEESNDHWWKREYEGGKEVYFEDSTGYISDNREPVDMTLEEVCKLAGKKVRITI